VAQFVQDDASKEANGGDDTEHPDQAPTRQQRGVQPRPKPAVQGASRPLDLCPEYPREQRKDEQEGQVELDWDAEDAPDAEPSHSCSLAADSDKRGVV